MDPERIDLPNEEAGSKQSCGRKGGIHACVQRMASSSTWLFSLAVFGTGIIATALFIYGFLLSIAAVFDVIIHFTLDIYLVKEFLGKSVQIIDIFLVATVFYLISLGLYELFIATAPLPGWVQIRNLDDLKVKLLGLTVIALAVIFLGTALSIEAGILELGAAVGIMIVAISCYLWVRH